jgi:hypothetical protein
MKTIKLVYFEIFVVLTARVSQIMTRNRMQTIKMIMEQSSIIPAFGWD